MASYFHKKCNKTIRKFYEDFDKLPRALKEIIWSQPHPPTFEDLKAAWQLADEMGHDDDVHVLRKDRKEQRGKDRAAKRRDEIAKANAKRWARYRNQGQQYRTLYKKVDLKDRNDKHARLVKLLPEEAMDLLARRTNADDVKEVFDWEYVPVGRVKVTNDPEDVDYFKTNRPPQSLSKMMDNAVGREGDSDIEKLANVSKKHRG